jgi:HEPN domain-containing protein
VNRKDLQQISRTRLKESAILLNAGYYDGAYYLASYCVECAIKACIAKQVRRGEFPDKDLANKAWVHDLEQLIGLAGLGADLKSEMRIDKDMALNWTIIKDWDETVRYKLGISLSKTEDFYSACSARKSGILPWIRKR